MGGLYIPFEKYKSVGGPATFMRNLRAYLKAVGYPYLIRPRQGVSIFFPISQKRSLLEKIRRHGGAVIQRLDGIHYPQKHGERYLALNEEIRTVYLDYADFVVFQSEYSRQQCFAMFGEKEHFAIVLNGVDTSLFYPETTREATLQTPIVFASSGSFRNRDMIEPMILALDGLTSNFDFRLKIIGPVAPEFEHFLQRSYVDHLGKLDLRGVANALRQSDVFIYSHLNPPCPNSVLEAVSCGLPVVGFDSGAMKELLFFDQSLLAPVSSDVFQAYEQFDFRLLQEKLRAAIAEFPLHKELSMAHCRHYSFERCGSRYVQIFERYAGQPARSSSVWAAFLKKIFRFG